MKWNNLRCHELACERVSFSVRNTYISTLNKGEKGDPKKSSQPLVQDYRFERKNKVDFFNAFLIMLSKDLIFKDHIFCMIIT